MKAKTTIGHMHDPYEALLTLTLTAEKDKSDAVIFETLKELLGRVIGEDKRRAVLYTCKDVELTPNQIVLKLTVGRKVLAKVDGLCNPCLEDLKFVVVKIDNDPGHYPNGTLGDVPHFPCYVCGCDSYGFSRDTMEVYDEASKGVKTVSVHDKCKLARLKQITMPSSIFTKTSS